MMLYAIDCAKKTGKSVMLLSGGVVAANKRAVCFYTKFGFRRMREFTTTVDNLDMRLDLEVSDPLKLS